MKKFLVGFFLAAAVLTNGCAACKAYYAEPKPAYHGAKDINAAGRIEVRDEAGNVVMCETCHTGWKDE